MGKILDGILVSKKIKKKIKLEINNLKIKPHLGIILIGENKESLIYVNNKIKDCKEVGIKTSLIKLSKNIGEEELLKIVNSLNLSNHINGYILQLPIPKYINEQKIIMAINPKKDVDGFHPENFGKMALEINTFLPATACAILYIFKYYKIATKGKKCLVIGRSNIVGKPISILMGNKNNPGNATVTVIHSNSLDIEFYTKNADIIIIAIGVPNFLKSSMIKKNSIIIDVGINQVKNNFYKKGYFFVGDADFDEIKAKTSYITPVPGGVGPVTRAMLLKNTLLAYKKNN